MKREKKEPILASQDHQKEEKCALPSLPGPYERRRNVPILASQDPKVEGYPTLVCLPPHPGGTLTPFVGAPQPDVVPRMCNVGLECAQK